MKVQIRGYNQEDYLGCLSGLAQAALSSMFMQNTMYQKYIFSYKTNRELMDVQQLRLVSPQT